MNRHKALNTTLGVIFAALMLFPVYWMINVSLTKTADMRDTPPRWYPSNPTLSGYTSALHDQLPNLLTSLIIGMGCVLITLIIALPAGYGLTQLRVRGAKQMNFVLLVAQMIPSVVMAMGFYATYVRLGWLDTLWGLILADSTIAVPFGVMLFSTYMAGIPKELIQAAKVDGAGPFRTFWSVALPISRNSALTVSLCAFLWSWSDFIFASTLNRDGSMVPITLGIYDYIGNNTTTWNAIMATAVVASVPAAFLIVVAQRYVAAGVTAGAVKV